MGGTHKRRAVPDGRIGNAPAVGRPTETETLLIGSRRDLPWRTVDGAVADGHLSDPAVTAAVHGLDAALRDPVIVDESSRRLMRLVNADSPTNRSPQIESSNSSFGTTRSALSRR